MVHIYEWLYIEVPRVMYICLSFFTANSDPMVAAGQKILHILQEEVFSEDEIKQRVANLSPPDGKRQFCLI